MEAHTTTAMGLMIVCKIRISCFVCSEKVSSRNIDVGIKKRAIQLVMVDRKTIFIAEEKRMVKDKRIMATTDLRCQGKRE